uniref:RHS repeat domain-containing protein n=1 Tax=Empedobacter brevis TaxID=247 RepID=UPI0021AA3F1F|nr:RHS repeat domain-containing protein [Empedobacter brevis]
MEYSDANARKISYDSYDTKGNLTQYTLENGIPVSIIWGYKGQYPIAKIEGSTNTELSNYIQLAEGNIQSNNDTYELIFEKIREHFPNSMITTYLYQPLVGVTSITAPNGQTEYYKYDEFGRLVEIRNDKKEVIKTFEYKYKP